MSEINSIIFEKSMEEKWDAFVENDSINGTFLQSRIFLNYHKNRFQDSSLILSNSGNIMAVSPAAVMNIDGEKTFYSHPGSTFGGIILSKTSNNIDDIEKVVDCLIKYCVENSFKKIILKNTGAFFCNGNIDLLDYILFEHGFTNYEELSFCLDYSKITNIIANFKSKTRNLYNKSLKFGLNLKQIYSKEDIVSFYSILCKSLLKYQTKPVHSLEEIFDLQERLKDKIVFYGVFYQGKMIAGSMVFIINNIFHTQYLAADSDYLFTQPMDFLDANLILEGSKMKCKGFSFGISTEKNGSYLNRNLAKYKEGFGTSYYLNKTFEKNIN